MSRAFLTILTSFLWLAAMGPTTLAQAKPSTSDALSQLGSARDRYERTLDGIRRELTNALDKQEATLRAKSVAARDRSDRATVDAVEVQIQAVTTERDALLSVGTWPAGGAREQRNAWMSARKQFRDAYMSLADAYFRSKMDAQDRDVRAQAEQFESTCDLAEWKPLDADSERSLEHGWTRAGDAWAGPELSATVGTERSLTFNGLQLSEFSLELAVQRVAGSGALVIQTYDGESGVHRWTVADGEIPPEAAPGGGRCTSSFGAQPTRILLTVREGQATCEGAWNFTSDERDLSESDSVEAWLAVASADIGTQFAISSARFKAIGAMPAELAGVENTKRAETKKQAVVAPKLTIGSVWCGTQEHTRLSLPLWIVLTVTSRERDSFEGVMCASIREINGKPSRVDYALKRVRGQFTNGQSGDLKDVRLIHGYMPETPDGYGSVDGTFEIDDDTLDLACSFTDQKSGEIVTGSTTLILTDWSQRSP